MGCGGLEISSLHQWSQAQTRRLLQNLLNALHPISCAPFYRHPFQDVWYWDFPEFWRNSIWFYNFYRRNRLKLSSILNHQILPDPPLSETSSTLSCSSFCFSQTLDCSKCLWWCFTLTVPQTFAWLPLSHTSVHRSPLWLVLGCFIWSGPPTHPALPSSPHKNFPLQDQLTYFPDLSILCKYPMYYLLSVECSSSPTKKCKVLKVRS